MRKGSKAGRTDGKVGWTKWKKERLTTFNGEPGRRIVLTMLVGGCAAVNSLIRHTHTMNDQGQQVPTLRAPHPLCVHQGLTIMIPYHSGEGLPIERAAELCYLTTFHSDISHFHQQLGSGGQFEVKAGLHGA